MKHLKNFEILNEAKAKPIKFKKNEKYYIVGKKRGYNLEYGGEWIFKFEDGDDLIFESGRKNLLKFTKDEAQTIFSSEKPKLVQVIEDIKKELTKRYNIEYWGGDFDLTFYPDYNTLNFSAGSRESHEYFDGSDSRITDEIVVQKLKSEGFEFTREKEDYDPGAEKGWHVIQRLYRYKFA